MLKHYYNRYSKKGILLNSLFLIALSSYGQSANVKGVIKDTSGKGIAGVTIRVKGGAETVQTEWAGEFFNSGISRKHLDHHIRWL